MRGLTGRRKMGEEAGEQEKANNSSVLPGGYWGPQPLLAPRDTEEGVTVLRECGGRSLRSAEEPDCVQERMAEGEERGRLNV